MTQHEPALRSIAASSAAALGAPAAEQELAWAGHALAGAMRDDDVAGLLTPAEHWHDALWAPACVLALPDRALLATWTGRVLLTELPYATAGGLHEHGRDPGGEPRAVFATGGAAPVYLRVPAGGDLPGLLVAAFAGRLDFTSGAAASASRSPRRLLVGAVAAIVVLAAGGGALAAVLAGTDDGPRSRAAAGTTGTTTTTLADETTTTETAASEDPPADVDVDVPDLTERIDGPGWVAEIPSESDGWAVADERTENDGAQRITEIHGPEGEVVLLVHTPDADAEPDEDLVVDTGIMKTAAERSRVVVVEDFPTDACEDRRCSDLLLNDPDWGGIALLVNGERGDRAFAVADAIARTVRSEDEADTDPQLLAPAPGSDQSLPPETYGG